MSVSSAAEDSAASAAALARVAAVRGVPRRGGATGAPVSAGEGIAPGDILRTDGYSSADILVPFASGESVLRVLPGASASLRRHSDDDQSDWSAEFEIEAGNAAVSAARGTSVLLSLPHAVAVVRGAAAAEASAGFSRISVLEGSAAFLPKGPLLAALLDGRTANPVAGAVVRAALASAPLVRAGEALEAATPADACEAAYSALLVGSERAISNGFVLDAAADPRPFIAAAGSPAAEALEAALSAYRPRRLSPDERTALSALDGLPQHGAPGR